MLGVEQLIKTHSDIIHSQTEWYLVFALMRSSMRQPAAARRCLEILSSLVMGAENVSPRVSTDNFGGLVSLLDEHAGLANVAIRTAGQQDRRKQAETPIL